MYMVSYVRVGVFHVAQLIMRLLTTMCFACWQEGAVPGLFIGMLHAHISVRLDGRGYPAHRIQYTSSTSVAAHRARHLFHSTSGLENISRPAHHIQYKPLTVAYRAACHPFQFADGAEIIFQSGAAHPVFRLLWLRLLVYVYRLLDSTVDPEDISTPGTPHQVYTHTHLSRRFS